MFEVFCESVIRGRAGALHFTDCTGGACGWEGPSAR
jgi:hypothetical protein